jgi:hypothetical protein
MTGGARGPADPPAYTHFLQSESFAIKHLRAMAVHAHSSITRF